MSKLILLNLFYLFCVLSISLAAVDSSSKSELVDANKTASSNDKKMIILDAKPVVKSPNARDLKQSESHIGILYPHYHHGHHGYHHHGLHHHGLHHHGLHHHGLHHHGLHHHGLYHHHYPLVFF